MKFKLSVQRDIWAKISSFFQKPPFFGKNRFKIEVFMRKNVFTQFLRYIIHSNHLHWNISRYRYWKWFLIRIRSGPKIIEIIRLSRTKPELAELKLDYLGLANIIRRTFEQSFQRTLSNMRLCIPTYFTRYSDNFKHQVALIGLHNTK